MSGVIFLVACFIAYYLHIAHRKRTLYKTTHTPSDALKHLHSAKPVYTSKAEYLQSPVWHAKRLTILQRDSYTCQRCGITGIPLEVHHLTYSHLYDEPLHHLVTVCRDCHQAIHDKYGYYYFDTFPLD